MIQRGKLQRLVLRGKRRTQPDRAEQTQPFAPADENLPMLHTRTPPGGAIVLVERMKLNSMAGHADRHHFQLKIAFPCGDCGPNSNSSMRMPFGSVAFATEESSGRARGSSTVTPRSFRAATVARKFSTCRPKWLRPGRRSALACCSSTNVLRLTWT